MFDYVIRTIQTKHGPFRAQFQELDGDRVLVLVGRADSEEFVPGTIFVRNWELRKHSPKKTLFMAYERGLYEAFRAGQHIDHGSGMAPSSPNGEVQEIGHYGRVLVDYVETMLHLNLLSSEDANVYRRIYDQMIASLTTKRNPYKIVARARFERGRQFTDSRGRTNVPAALMSAGAGRTYLREREGEIRRIGHIVSARTLQIFQTIKVDLSVYDDLRHVLGGERGNGHGRLFALLRGSDLVDGMRVTIPILEAHAKRFARIREFPFRRNALRTASDLRNAVRTAYRLSTLCKELESTRSERIRSEKRIELQKQLDELTSLYERLRHGVAWVYALHMLEMDILAPLSLLIEASIRRSRFERITSGESAEQTNHHQPFNVSTDAFRFEQIRSTIAVFNERLCRFDDTMLVHPIGMPFRTHVERAIEASKVNNWILVKKELKSASQIV